MSKSWMMVGVALIGVLVGCDGDPQLVKPASQGQRGEACQARNDCASGLACVNFICSKNDFQISVTAKHCDRIDCSVDQDCCGDRPLTAPTKCASRDSLCTPYIATCLPFSNDTCTSDATCGGGSCLGYCTNTFDDCTAPADCSDTCIVTVNGGTCAQSGNFCTTSADCSGTCTSRNCACDNALYDPINVICDDPDCIDICTLRCNEERCVRDTSCAMDSDCFINGLQHCTTGGQCVECEAATEATDCTGEGEECRDNVCVVPCMKNEECPLFHQCQAGDCVPTGCSSDRECVLALSSGGSSQDARLSKCLPSDQDASINICKIPCENDAACPNDFEVCSAGFCTFIGCETNEDCRAFLGIEDQMTSTSRPWISTAECREAVVTP